MNTRQIRMEKGSSNVTTFVPRTPSDFVKTTSDIVG